MNCCRTTLGNVKCFCTRFYSNFSVIAFTTVLKQVVLLIFPCSDFVIIFFMPVLLNVLSDFIHMQVKILPFVAHVGYRSLFSVTVIVFFLFMVVL